MYKSRFYLVYSKVDGFKKFQYTLHASAFNQCVCVRACVCVRVQTPTVMTYAPVQRGGELWGTGD